MNSARQAAVQTGLCRRRGCGRSLLWVRTENGKRMPLDPFPDAENGTVILAGELKVAKVFGSPQQARAYQFTHEGDGPYVAHFGTCKGQVPARRSVARPAGGAPKSSPPAPDPQMKLGDAA